VTKETITRYDGCAKVVVWLYTPMKFDYNTKTQRLVVSFFIQRYDKDDIAVDQTLQALINQESAEKKKW